MKDHLLLLYDAFKNKSSALHGVWQCQSEENYESDPDF